MRLPDDPEPDRRHRGRLIAAVAVVVVVGGAVAGAVVGTAGGRSPRTQRSAQPRVPAPGRLLVWDTDAQRIDIETPDGVQSRPASSRQIVGYPLASPDGHYLVTQQGADLLTVAGSRLTARTPQLGPPTNGSGFLPQFPFADHGHYLIAPRPPSSEATVGLVDQRTNHYVRLGSGDDAAGDPAAPAVYVAVAHGRPVPNQPDDRIERRTTTGRRAIVVTAAQIRRLAHLPAHQLLNLATVPGPDGAGVAVLATAVAGEGGVVVAVTSAGRVVEVVHGRGLGVAGWSPDGRDLAVVAGRPVRLLIWSRADHRITSTALPSSSEWFSCVWEPSDTWIACAGALPGRRVDSRLLVDLGSHHSWVVPAGGMPVVWLSEAAA